MYLVVHFRNRSVRLKGTSWVNKSCALQQQVLNQVILFTNVSHSILGPIQVSCPFTQHWKAVPKLYSFDEQKLLFIFSLNLLVAMCSCASAVFYLEQLFSFLAVYLPGVFIDSSICKAKLIKSALHLLSSCV